MNQLLDASLVIWTTTPWTIPGNRAICYSSRIAYSLYEVTQDGLPDDNWVQKGDLLVLADALAADVFKNARIEAFERGARGFTGKSWRPSPVPTRSPSWILAVTTSMSPSSTAIT